VREALGLHFVLRLLAGGCDAASVVKVMLASPPYPACVSSEIARAALSVQPTQPLMITVTLPYHPAFEMAGARAKISALSSSIGVFLRPLFQRPVCFRLAWSKSTSHLFVRLRKM
jgi:hypothetical protein